MGVFKKLKLWRGLGKFLNNPLISKMVYPFQGIVNFAVTLPEKKRRDDTKLAPVSKPLAQSKICVINTAGIYLEGDTPFDVDSAKGDPTFRIIPSDFDPARLKVAHTHYPHRYFLQDHNVILPIDPLRTLVKLKVLGGFAPNFYSFGFSGGITREFIDPETGTAHVLAKRLLADKADFVLMVPA